MSNQWGPQGDPAGWDPYATPQQYGPQGWEQPGWPDQQDYAVQPPTSGWEAPAAPMAPRYAPPPPPRISHGGATASLVFNILALVWCLGLPSIGGIALAAMAIGEHVDEERVSRLTRWSWVCLALTPVLWIGFFFLLFIIGALA
ncbi:hypothetical protein [Allonocardiopsis opalescens]|uniref:Uncharacterized protein n=1 Tax=Allonocardiopsis opalescens TaxID=1144618 RepID=A0A2T0QA33_9ACTN|nr:hypothetical protein [Allonocardiopsis opalescens]PRY00670.1 hypothetical protein CLV72_102301 [Allonocardiopsis opalescens]